jgi:fluoroquinolone resistance protein
MHDVVFEDCDLRGATFAAVTFRRRLGRRPSDPKAAFLRCNFHLADLSAAELAQCVFTGSRFREADLASADLEGADLRDCDLFGAGLDGARIADADLRGADISGLDLSRVASRKGVTIRPDQQHLLLNALGVDIRLSGDLDDLHP